MPRFIRRVPRHGHPQRQAGGFLPLDNLTARGKLRRGLATPRSYYRRFILQLLRQAEGHALPSREIRRTMQMRLAGRFTAADVSLLRRNLPRWVNSMQWERKQMVMEGLLEPTSTVGHSIWRATRKGLAEAAM